MASTNTFWMAAPWDDYGQNAIFNSVANEGERAPFLFLGWDSAWYLSITAKSYVFSDQSFAFFPALPLFSWLLNLIVQNPVYALIAVSLISGVLWIPIFQLVAEQYTKKTTALVVTLLFASFPYVFLFTTVAYSEGLFLLSTLSAWYFIKKEKIASSSLSAALATLSRVPGLLLLMPMLIEHFWKRPHSTNFKSKRNIFYFSIPFQAFFAWVFYVRILSNDWFAFGNRVAWNGMQSFRVLIFDVLPKSGIQGVVEMISQHWPFSFMWIPFLLVSPILIYAVIKMEKSLAAYSIVYVSFVLLFGAVDSIPRFFSFCFPLWLAVGIMLFRRRNAKLAVPVIFVLFGVLSVYLWQNFLNGIFIA
jgi:Gpi18-like mannosyltransferase